MYQHHREYAEPEQQPPKRPGSLALQSLQCFAGSRQGARRGDPTAPENHEQQRRRENQDHRCPLLSPRVGVLTNVEAFCLAEYSDECPHRPMIATITGCNLAEAQTTTHHSQPAAISQQQPEGIVHGRTGGSQQLSANMWEQVIAASSYQPTAAGRNSHSARPHLRCETTCSNNNCRRTYPRGWKQEAYPQRAQWLGQTCKQKQQAHNEQRLQQQHQQQHRRTKCSG